MKHGEPATSAWLITGASGFLGRHLCDRLLRERPSGLPPLVAVGRRDPKHSAVGSFRPVDLLDRKTLNHLIAEVQPSVVFHLAGKTPPGDSEDFYRHNTMASVSLLDALRALGHRCRVVLVGSASELGLVPVEALPVGEDRTCQPADPYGLSKWLATSAGLAAGPPLEVIIARVFNLIGPGMPSSQALGRFAEGLARGSGPFRLSVGDLEGRRDFVDARDVAGALVALATRGAPGRVYHVGTGRSRRIQEGLDLLIALSGREVLVEADPAKVPNRGPTDSRADIRRIVGETGWSPQVAWEQSLRDLWDHEVERARIEAGLTDPRASV